MARSLSGDSPYVTVYSLINPNKQHTRQEPRQERTHLQLSRVALDILPAPAVSAEAGLVSSRARRQIPFDRECLKADIISQTGCLER